MGEERGGVLDVLVGFFHFSGVLKNQFQTQFQFLLQRNLSIRYPILNLTNLADRGHILSCLEVGFVFYSEDIRLYHRFDRRDG